MREAHRKAHERHHHEGGRPPWGRHGRERWFGPGWGGGRRARRGDVRTALLAMLDERPMHGYDLIQELEQRSGGAWRPSPGSIYPTLQMLEEEGLISGEDQDAKRVFSLTGAGKAELEQRRERDGGAAPWEAASFDQAVSQLRESMFGLGAAAMQVGRTGSEAQQKKAAEVLAEARKQLYRILAED
jgi:DNA-binding PadR family transcriptional regulator